MMMIPRKKDDFDIWGDMFRNPFFSCLEIHSSQTQKVRS